MKKLQLLILILASVLLLQSCDGIGDGALVGGGGYSPIKRDDHADTTAVADTIAKVENVQTTQKEALTRPSVIAQLGEIKSCDIFLTVNGQSVSALSLTDEEAAEVYRLFSEAGGKYSTDNIGLNLNNCIIVTFADADGGKETFKVGTNNYFMKGKSTTPSIASSGTINGLYNSLVGYLD